MLRLEYGGLVVEQYLFYLSINVNNYLTILFASVNIG